MANLRDIRNRISSINNTQQITRAMKMVAAAKLRKAQNKMSANRPYVRKLNEVVARLAANSGSGNALLNVREEKKRLLFIVIGSDRGLCGAFNNNLFKVVEQTLSRDYKSFLDHKLLDLVCIGKKSDAYFKKRNFQIAESYPGFFDDLNYSDTVIISRKAIEEFTGGKYDEVYIAYNEFKSVIAQNRIVRQILPVVTEGTGEGLGQYKNGGTTDYIYEPDVESILDRLLPLNVHIALWSALLESNASEQGARMAAMDNATENAKELAEELRLQYNKARQSAITTEISEIVSGAQALEDT